MQPLRSNHKKRLLLICDFSSETLIHHLEPYECLRDIEVILVRRGTGVPPGLPKVRLVNIPLPVVGTTNRLTIQKLVSLSLNTLAYLLFGSLISTFLATRARCQAIHAYFLFPQGAVGLLASFLSMKPLIVTIVGTDANSYLQHALGRAYVRAMSRFATLVSVSEPIQETLRGMGVTSHFVPNSIRVSEWPFVPQSDKSNLLIFVGRLDQNKRPLDLVEAIYAITGWARSRGLEVRIAGDGPQRDILAARILELDLGGVIEIEGQVSTSRIKELMSKAKVYVSCSMNEGMSFALLEAMASGCLVIASDAPGNAALICDGVNGNLYGVGDTNELAKKIEEAFLDDEKSTAMTTNARTNVDRNHDLDKGAKVLDEVYATLATN
jgi:glycosyltransferase involved in cell wall biosynthesis